MGEVWCDLNRVDADHENVAGVSGVYVIWHGKDDDRTVLKIGAGVISKELKNNKDDIAVQAFAQYGLKVTWAETPKSKTNRIDLFLNTELKPKFAGTPPKAKPLEVNDPWEVFEIE
jgi:hypothetical protein